MSKPRPPADFDENPEWTADEFAQARPASSIHSSKVVEALVRSPQTVTFGSAMRAQGALAHGWRLAA
jgi:hypothetical protein